MMAQARSVIVVPLRAVMTTDNPLTILTPIFRPELMLARKESDCIGTNHH